MFSINPVVYIESLFSFELLLNINLPNGILFKLKSSTSKLPEITGKDDVLKKTSPSTIPSKKNSSLFKKGILLDKIPNYPSFTPKYL